MVVVLHPAANVAGGVSWDTGHLAGCLPGVVNKKRMDTHKIDIRIGYLLLVLVRSRFVTMVCTTTLELAS